MTSAVPLPLGFAAVAPPEPDAEGARLLAALATGDRTSLGPLYDRYARDLYALALWRSGSREDAEDVVQEVFCRLATTGADLSRVRDPKSYLLSMAHRACVDRRRARRATEPIQDAFLEASPFAPERASDAATASRALTSLPEAQREAIFLHHFGGLPFREIGRVTGVPTFTAASRYRLGLSRLKKLLGADA